MLTACSHLVGIKFDFRFKIPVVERTGEMRMCPAVRRKDTLVQVIGILAKCQNRICSKGVFSCHDRRVALTAIVSVVVGPQPRALMGATENLYVPVLRYKKSSGVVVAG